VRRLKTLETKPVKPQLTSQSQEETGKRLLRLKVVTHNLLHPAMGPVRQMLLVRKHKKRSQGRRGSESQRPTLLTAGKPRLPEKSQPPSTE